MSDRWTAEHTVRVYAVVNLRAGRVHGVTCNVNQAAAWVREIIGRYGNDPLAATQCVDLVNPKEMAIPYASQVSDHSELPEGAACGAGDAGLPVRDDAGDQPDLESGQHAVTVTPQGAERPAP